ncbi:hypothetical protein [Shinella zoogloeoides]|uniref:hypothetical protein n=1 Tax=Shinella zoogloeoides TaxID=352475 RepID=UPI0028AF054B|nr:hypothetical protein [Shinella zoogloeoides]
MSTVNLTGLRLELGKANAAKQRAREDELKTLRAETDILRKQMKTVIHHVNFLRDCMLRQTRMNEQIIDYVDRRDRRTAP